MMRPSMFAWSVLCVLATLLFRVGGQSAQMDGGRPPVDVEQRLCDIGAVFAKLSMIKNNADCIAGCAHGTGACPADWYPNSGDTCSAACGVVFEPFWDQCGAMLTTAGMGGMDEMGIFYDRCLESLYPPGVCGTFCNQHTYDCFLADTRSACCDEDGHNWSRVQGLALVEYAMQLQVQGCVLDLSGVSLPVPLRPSSCQLLALPLLSRCGSPGGREAPAARAATRVR